MSKKIVLVGPPKAGKTTLRKIFFEGENSKRLLEFGLEPTHGQESIYLKLSKNVGIFDLAGQENQRWFETDDKKIFYNVDVLIVVIDISMSLEEIIDFTKKVINIKNDMSPSCITYVLFHKIDLVQTEKISKLIRALNKIYPSEKKTNFLFTSVKREYIAKTFSYFIEILNRCLTEENILDKSGFTLLEKILKILYYLHERAFISIRDLKTYLDYSDIIIQEILDHLISEGYAQYSGIENQEVFFLTSKGKKQFTELLEIFSLENLIKVEKYAHIDEESLQIITKKYPPFIGVLISDKKGINLIAFDAYDGALQSIIKNNFIKEAKNPLFYKEIIPSFLSALENFFKAENGDESNHLKLEGGIIHIFHFKSYIITFFTNSEVNNAFIESLIKQHLIKLYNKYEIEFKVHKSGSIIYNSMLTQNGRIWLNNLNSTYEKLSYNLEFFDVDYARRLFDELDKLSEIIDINNIEIHNQIKDMKVKLMKSVLKEDLMELKNLTGMIKELSLKFQI